MLTDRSVLIRQKLVENAKIQKFKCDILSKFQTLCDLIDKKAKSQVLFSNHISSDIGGGGAEGDKSTTT